MIIKKGKKIKKDKRIQFHQIFERDLTNGEYERLTSYLERCRKNNEKRLLRLKKEIKKKLFEKFGYQTGGTIAELNELINKAFQKVFSK